MTHYSELHHGEAESRAVRAEAPTTRMLLGACLFFGLVTAAMLHRQIQEYTSVPDLGDPLFSMWRLGWVAHQLPRDPWHLFYGNIFHPAERTLAYSDAMLLPASMAAPALWLGASLPAVYTSLLLFSYVAAGAAMFVLVFGVTRHPGAAVISGLIFAFDTFRFAHYSHLELQFTFCMPLAVFFLLRALATGSRRDAAASGVFVALQGLASLYYGVYFAVSLVVLVICWHLLVKRIDGRGLANLALAAAIAGAVCVPITVPYWMNRSTVGERGAGEVESYSATPHDYLTAYRRSAVYGELLWDANDGERKLFPGSVPLALGLAALVPPIEPIVGVVAITLAASIDASFGLHGVMYRVLYKVPPIRAFRVPARFRAIVGLYLALMTGFAVARFARYARPRWMAPTVLAALGLAWLVEVHPSLELQPVWKHAPGIYDFVPDSRAVIADMPVPGEKEPFWHDSVYMYFSTFHWHPIVNGNSGFTPPWYNRLAELGRDFPSDVTLDEYARMGTEYFVLHEGYYRDTFKRVVRDAESQPRLRLVASVMWEEGECRLYRLLR